MRRAVVVLLALALGLCAPLPAAAQQDPAVLDRINARIQSEGRPRVIVELRLPAGAHVAESQLSPRGRHRPAMSSGCFSSTPTRWRHEAPW